MARPFSPNWEGKLRLSFFLFSCLLALPVQASELGRGQAWRAVLHFPKGAAKSLIDDPSFFISPRGQINPQAELEASIAAFSANPIKSGDESPQCRWAGRYRWLSRHAPELAQNFVPQACPAWDALYSRVKPNAATLVFPDGYMNSPASMFGHTLLRIDQDNGHALRSFAVNYAANTNEENGIAYAFNGLSGRYKGFFSLMPYPEKLQEYQFGEQRDIWEYSLTLSPSETEAIFDRVWDLQNTFSYYYFLDRNCSYQLLALIESVRPELDLLNGWGATVIPIDTIRRLEAASLIKGRFFRPSQASQIHKKIKRLSNTELDTVISLARPEVELNTIQLSDDSERRSLILDTAVDYLQWSRAKQGVSIESYRKRFLDLLRQRSQIMIPTTGHVQNSVPVALDPVQGHGTKKLSIGHIQQGDLNEIGLTFRPAFHDIRDRPNGYRVGAGISFVEFQARWDKKHNQLKFDHFDLLKIESLSVQNALMKPISWRLNVGARRSDPMDRTTGLQAFATMGAGNTYSFGNDQWLAYGTAEVVVGRDQTTRTHFSDLGLRLGMQWHPSQQWGLTVTAQDWLNTTKLTKVHETIEFDLSFYAKKNTSFNYQNRSTLAVKQIPAIHTFSVNWFY